MKKYELDERIRKELCKAIWTYVPTEEGQEYIAWLEKQSEKKSSDEVLKIRQEVYQSGYNDGYKHGFKDAKQVYVQYILGLLHLERTK